ncbi:MAG: ADP-ribosylglycohydrolase family protein, partial [Candidatus Riflebacteria bacterium]|nr:ADP-ribosylglycohydrolase family protein [Candidatus Riflebacteria bacterium]
MTVSDLRPMLPVDHDVRLQRALFSLAGLSVGDAFGERFFGPPGYAQELIARRKPPPPKWTWTDDTAMALSIGEVLTRHGNIDQDDLASCFARRYEEEPGRGYGAGARQILSSVGAGVSWKAAAGEPFGGTGSHGNGAAMRVAPLGAYFAEDPEQLVAQALLSAQVT